MRPQFTIRCLLAFVTGIAVLCAVARQVGPHVAFAIATLILAGVLLLSLMLLSPWRTTAAGAGGACAGWLFDSLCWGWSSPYAPALLGGVVAGLCLASGTRTSSLHNLPIVVQPIRGAPPQWLRIILFALAWGLPLVVLLVGWLFPVAWRQQVDFSWTRLAELAMRDLRNEPMRDGLRRHLGFFWPAHLFAVLACIAALRQRRFANRSTESEDALYRVAVFQCLAGLFFAFCAVDIYASMFRFLSLEGNWDETFAYLLGIVTVNAAGMGLLFAASCAILGRRVATLWQRHGWLAELGIFAVGALALLIAWTFVLCLARLR